MFQEFTMVVDYAESLDILVKKGRYAQVGVLNFNISKPDSGQHEVILSPRRFEVGGTIDGMELSVRMAPDFRRADLRELLVFGAMKIACPGALIVSQSYYGKKMDWWGEWICIVDDGRNRYLRAGRELGDLGISLNVESVYFLGRRTK